MTQLGCMLCGNTECLRLGSVASPQVLEHNLGGKYGHSVTYVVCKGCGLMFQFPMATDEQCRELYSGTYRDEALNDAGLRFDQNRAAVVAKWLDGYLGSSGAGRRALDIGCGSGAYLLALRERGWDVRGMEPQDQWADLARQRFGLPVTTGFYGAQSYPDQSFDLVLMSHVIEHLPDPRPALAAVRRHLTPGGRLFVGTPNVALPKLEPHIGSFNAAHVCLYSLNTLTRLLAACGFRISACINLWPSYGLALLAEASDETLATTAADDAQAIVELYLGLLRTGAAGVWGRNLAALHPRYPALLQLLCGRMTLDPYRLVRTPEGGIHIGVKDGTGPVRLYDAIPDVRAIETVMHAVPGDLTAPPVVLTGRGWWRAAPDAFDFLRDGQRLLIREPDPRIFKLALTAFDLEPLLASPLVAVQVGPVQQGDHLWRPASSTGTRGPVIRNGVPTPPTDVPAIRGGH